MNTDERYFIWPKGVDVSKNKIVEGPTFNGSADFQRLYELIFFLLLRCSTKNLRIQVDGLKKKSKLIL